MQNNHMIRKWWNRLLCKLFGHYYNHDAEVRRFFTLDIQMLLLESVLLTLEQPIILKPNVYYMLSVDYDAFELRLYQTSCVRCSLDNDNLTDHLLCNTCWFNTTGMPGDKECYQIQVDDNHLILS